MLEQSTWYCNNRAQLMDWKCDCSRNTCGVTDERSDSACWKLNTGVNGRETLCGQSDKNLKVRIYVTHSIDINF
jgi:hypothetical protein